MATASSPTSRPPQRTMSTHSIEFVSGTHQFTIAGYSLQKRIGPGKSIRSGAFEVGGYSWTIKCYPVGYEKENKEHVSLFLELMSSAIETVSVQFGFEINGPAGRFYKPRSSNDFTPTNRSWGYKKFIEVESVESQYLMNDCLAIACTVEVQEPKTGATRSRFIDLPPSRVLEDLAQLLKSKQGSDVTFQVGPNDYAAHRMVLAMRSPVFKAQFFGPLAEDNAGSGGDADGRVVRIHDMEPTAFEAVLHFIYRDSLPPVQDDESQIEVVGEWLAAADRYCLERMRLLCENVLCVFLLTSHSGKQKSYFYQRGAKAKIDVENAAATLVLADRHNCPKLKAFCVDYIASPGLLRAVLATEGYAELKLSCPSLLTEIVEKIASRCC